MIGLLRAMMERIEGIKGEHVFMYYSLLEFQVRSCSRRSALCYTAIASPTILNE